MTRLLYSLVWHVALPMVLLRLWWRGRKEPGYRQNVAQRLGFYDGLAGNRTQQGMVWVHAVSVGETRAAGPLIDALLQAFPDRPILLTHMTATGLATGRSLFGSRVVQSYLPYDAGWMVARFLRYFRPCVCILIETEVWPNLIAQCAARQIPVALVNARLSERSLRKAQRWSSLLAPAARAIACVAAQTGADARRLQEFGAQPVHITGSLKFDVTVPAAWLEQGDAWRVKMGSRPVLLCANTRDGEEVLILDAFCNLGLPHVLLIIVPRHPQRFDEVARLIASRNLKFARRSAMTEDPEGGAPEAEADILLGDSMGEMFAYYAACDLAFVGGSLLPLGGHNLIEPCALGKPVLIGPHTFNFAAITEDAILAGAALRVRTAGEVMQQARDLLQSDARRDAMGRNAKEFALQHRGATLRTLALLRPLIERK